MHYCVRVFADLVTYVVVLGNNLHVSMCVVADYQLTEEMFIKNLWVSVNQPDFKEKVTHQIYSPVTNPT